jgi:hypothetical protein
LPRFYFYPHDRQVEIISQQVKTVDETSQAIGESADYLKELSSAGEIIQTPPDHSPSGYVFFVYEDADGKLREEPAAPDRSDQFMLYVCLRPRMYFDPIATTRDIITFVCGIGYGIDAGCGEYLSDFGEYVNQRFDKSPYENWVGHLMQEFDDKSITEGGKQLGQLIVDWIGVKACRS